MYARRPKLFSIFICLSVFARPKKTQTGVTLSSSPGVWNLLGRYWGGELMACTGSHLWRGLLFHVHDYSVIYPSKKREREKRVGGCVMVFSKYGFWGKHTEWRQAITHLHTEKLSLHCLVLIASKQLVERRTIPSIIHLFESWLSYDFTIYFLLFYNF